MTLTCGVHYSDWDGYDRMVAAIKPELFQS